MAAKKPLTCRLADNKITGLIFRHKWELCGEDMQLETKWYQCERCKILESTFSKTERDDLMLSNIFMLFLIISVLMAYEYQTYALLFIATALLSMGLQMYLIRKARKSKYIRDQQANIVKEMNIA